VRAGVLYAQHDLRVEHRPDPIAGPGELVIEVAYNGLCGTDATEYGKASIMVPLEVRHPGSGHVGPTILGHEFVGTVVDAVAELKSWLGKRVACGAGVSCGACAWCRRGRTNLCASYYTLGLSTHGGLAQFVAAPARICREIPESCSDEDAALTQPLAIGLHALRRSGLSDGARVVLLGVGAIGSFICAGLRGHGGQVVAFDVDENRLEMARSLGAAETHLLSRDATPEDVRDVLPDGADVVFETSGVAGAAGRAFALASRGGTVMLVGLTKTPQALNLADLVLREVEVTTTVAHVCDHDIPEALASLTERPLAPLLLDRVISLSDVVAGGLEPLLNGTASGKILVDPRGG
jgi:(R,R)-butanediol dehydrogenase / meso-butanediol dehydrogenase / diacetyl reductase